MKNIEMNWTLGHHAEKEQMPSAWVEGNVPGNAQLDWARANDYADYHFADNYKQWVWMEDCYWTYQTALDIPTSIEGQAVYFQAKGIDYECEIYLNDHLLTHHIGMFSEVKVLLTPYLKKENNLLKVVVFPIPKSHHNSYDRTQAVLSAKPAVSYGWDWHPRLVPSGIWDEAVCIVTASQAVKSMVVDYDLNLEQHAAKVNLELDFWGGNLVGGSYLLQVMDQDKCVKELPFKGYYTNFELTDLKLWWCVGHGEAFQYDFVLTDLETEQQISRKVAFRQVALVMNEGAYERTNTFPKSRSCPPVQMELNGQKIFLKGTNWVNPEIFPGTITDARYHELIDLALEANMNILRVWGGGIVNKDAFHHYCDEKGMLVWQEFPLACNDHPNEKQYLKVLKSEATAIVKRLKQFASTVLWCGGNELFNSWSGMTDQSHALRLLNSICFEHDPNTPFLPTAPVMGMGHGHYAFFDEDTQQDVFEWMFSADCTAYSEFGMPSPAFENTIQKIIPVEEQFPPRPTEAWKAHHAYGAWTEQTWLNAHIIEKYFGKSEDLSTLVARGQQLQKIGYQCIFETARQKQPYCSMALNWCFNEPWPTAANNSIVDYDNQIKPAFYSIKDALRPVLASAQFQRFSYDAGEWMEMDLWMLNDGQQQFDGLNMTVTVCFGEECQQQYWNGIAVKPYENTVGPRLRVKIPQNHQGLFNIKLSVENHSSLDSTYDLVVKQMVKWKDAVAVLNI
ncbi:glycoside hydrolase family 2 protein [Persicobacter psychrovividus]|uniref:Beta-mannosidase n=1 Tax=Persicobacter psychrovividus TaxID=387638 RepID=A0ABN6LDH0_9BACT|nr:beta-mannosidase [Persicobacter psychrovividus]